ncbi:MAG TPA: hypothetical protein VHW23_19415 [Kofleriaceae bacterium]|nr:hypothetical protein [Kofleriaceae bacterium]
MSKLASVAGNLPDLGPSVSAAQEFSMFAREIIGDPLLSFEG